MPADEGAVFRAAGLAMVPWSEADVFELFEWHACDDQPNCSGGHGQPCACAGVPWPSTPIQAAIGAAAPLIRADERAKVRAELLADNTAEAVAEATEQHHIVSNRTDALGNSPCVCDGWWDSGESESWDQHMAAIALRVLADRIAPDPKETT